MILLLATIGIFATALALLLAAAWHTGRDEIRAERLADPAPMPGELPAPGYLSPFPETGPMRLGPIDRSRLAAQHADLEREVRRMVADAEQAIPPRWRS